MRCAFIFYVKISIMIEKYWLEFSKIYARLMRLELTIKQNSFNAIEAYYANNSLDVFINFFNNKRRKKRYTNERCNKLELIILHPKLSQLQKIKKLINTLYLSDILNLVLKTKQFKISELDKIFYYKIPDKYIILENCIKDLTQLRNCIAHYNFKLYQENKRKFLDSLFLFEIHMGHNIAGIAQLPKLENPSIKNIIQSVYTLKPDLITNLSQINKENTKMFCNQHRLVLSLFDDIAIYNGTDANDLSSPWTILREFYRFKAKIKN